MPARDPHQPTSFGDGETAGPVITDGREFISQDASLEIFATRNSERETARTLKRRLLEDEEGYDVVTYAPSGENWLVLSGFRGDKIFYEKYLLRDGIIHAFGMEFPASAKPIYAPVVEAHRGQLSDGCAFIRSVRSPTQEPASSSETEGHSGRRA